MTIHPTHEGKPCGCGALTVADYARPCLGGPWTPPGFTVTCPDGVVRHAAPFPTRGEADHFAEWGHCCIRDHTITGASR